MPQLLQNAQENDLL